MGGIIVQPFGGIGRHSRLDFYRHLVDRRALPLEPDDKLLNHVQLQDVLARLCGELNLAIQRNFLQRSYFPVDRRAQTVGDDHLVIRVEPLVGQGYRMVASGRPDEGSFVAHADGERHGFARTSLGGWIYLQPGHPVARSHLDRLAPGGRTLIRKPTLYLFDQIQLQGEIAGLERRPHDGLGQRDVLTRRDRTGQVGALPFGGVASGVDPVIAQAHGPRARVGPGAAAIVAQRDTELNHRSSLHPPGCIDLQPGCPIIKRHRRHHNLVFVVHRIPEIVLDAGLVFNSPAHLLGVVRIADNPAKEDQGLDGLVVRILVPIVDLPVGVAHPPCVCVSPGHILVRLGDVHRPLAQRRGDGRHKVTVSAKVPVIVLERGTHLGVIEHKVGFLAVGVSMQGDAIHLVAEQVEDIGKIAHPVAALVARVPGLGVPGSHSACDHLVLRVTGPPVDLIPAFSEAGGIQLGRNDLASGATRPFVGQVHLVANDPDMTARAGLYKIATTPGKIIILAGVRDRACASVAVIQPHEHTQALRGQVGVVAAGKVVGIGAKGFGHQHPTPLVLAQHQVLAPPIVHAKNVRGIEIRHCSPPYHGNGGVGVSRAVSQPRLGSTGLGTGQRMAWLRHVTLQAGIPLPTC